MNSMGKIAVFDSGLGSLSIILAIRKITKAEIIYFADQKHYPYGTKNKKELQHIIESSIKLLKNNFKPDLIVVGSNTPTVLLPDIFEDKTVIGVYPHIIDAVNQTKTKSIAILGTHGTINSSNLQLYIKNNIPKNLKIIRIDATELIDLVESGKFLTNETFCITKIKKILYDLLVTSNVDVVTLSSTHLPFLHSLLKKIFPQILFLDPAESIAHRIMKQKNFPISQKNSLTIFTSGDVFRLQNNLQKLKIKNKAHLLQI